MIIFPSKASILLMCGYCSIIWAEIEVLIICKICSMHYALLRVIISSIRLNKSTNEISKLLSFAVIEDGLCRYSFSNDLIPQLVNPSTYARINLLTQTNSNQNTHSSFTNCALIICILAAPVLLRWTH